MIIRATIAAVFFCLASTCVAQGIPVYGPPRVIGIEKREIQVPIYQRPQIGTMQPVYVPRCSLLPCIVRFKRQWVFVPTPQQQQPLPPSSSTPLQGARWRY